MGRPAGSPGPGDGANGDFATGASRGVFWVVEGELLAFPFRDGVYREGVAKSGDTYSHERLWAAASVSGRPFDYHPRGRVHVSGGGETMVYVSPRIDVGRWLPRIMAAFDVADDRCRVIVDHSAHYRCHLDEGWQTPCQQGRSRSRGRRASGSSHGRGTMREAEG